MSRAGRTFGLRRLSSNRLNIASYIEELGLMVFIRKASALVAVAVFALFNVSTVQAANATTSKVSVPGNMVKGSLVTSGRSFYRTSLPEDTLAGIRLGRKAQEILNKWGNPSRITIGSVQAQVQDVASPTQPGIPYVPSGGDNPYASLTNSLNNAFNKMGVAPSGPGGLTLPTMPGLDSPGAGGMPGPGGAPMGSPTPQTSSITQEEVTWTYDLPNGITLEFIVTDGVITQITCGGVGPWGLSKTRTGLQLGDTYKLAIWVAGYPEAQNYVGRFLRISYVEKNRALYTFLNNKVVGITIALVPSELRQ